MAEYPISPPIDTSIEAVKRFISLSCSPFILFPFLWRKCHWGGGGGGGFYYIGGGVFKRKVRLIQT